MAQSARNRDLEHRTNRLRLDPQREPYWIKIDAGVYLGYYRPERGGGTWWARRLVPGTKRYAKAALGSADDYRDASSGDVLTFFQAQAKARTHATRHADRAAAAPLAGYTVADACARYMTWFATARKSVDATQATIDGRILPELGTIALAELTASRIETWMRRIAESAPRRRRGRHSSSKPVSAAGLSDDAKRARRVTANRCFNVLRAILNYAFRHDLIDDDRAWRRVHTFRGVEQPAVRFLTEAESARLIEKAAPDFRSMVKAALFTGMRYGELCRLSVADVNIDRGEIYVRSSKAGKPRHVPLNAAGLDFFRDLVEGRDGSSPAIVRVDGEPWGKSHQFRPLSEACAAAKIKPAVTFHDLRHTYASLLAQAGVDLLRISKLLGHADTRVTSRHYAHLTDDTLGRAVRSSLPGFGHKVAGNVKTLRPRRAA